MSGNNGHFDDGRATGKAELANLLASVVPIGITESDALGFVEGSLDPADQERVASALSASPAARGLLYAMRSDREGVRDLGRLSASLFEGVPAGLVDGALTRARMTISPAAPEAIAVAQPVRLRPVVSNRFALPLPAVLSVAAFVAVSSVAAIVFIALQNSVAPNVGPIAQGPGDADSTSDPLVPPITTHETARAPSVTDTTSHEPMTVAAAPESASPDAISIDEAFDLARAGRLVIRVESSDPSDTALRLARLPSEQRRFALEREQDSTLSHTLAAMFPHRAPLGIAEDPTAIASRSEIPKPAVDLGTIEQYQPVAMRANLVASREAFESLVLSLDGVEGASVFFEAVDAPIDLGPALPRPEEIFWWRSPPEHWAGWTRIPAIVHKAPR